MKNIYILYHKNCTDGFGAAYAAWKKFKNKAKYFEVNYEEPIPEIEKNSTVYVLDFCLTEEITEKIKQHSKVITLDHHVASENKIKASNEFIYDLNRSGAKLSWDYFHQGKENKLINHISDKDLGKFLLEHTKEIITGLESYVRNFEVWDKLNINQLYTEGSNILRNKNNEIRILLDKVYFHKIGKHKVPVINTSVYMGETAEKLLEIFPDAKFSGTYYIFEKNNKMYKKWSLRSKKLDVHSVAKEYGGGGHTYSAAFIEEINKK